MKRKMNCEIARNFSVLMALEKLGHFPKKQTEQDAWFLSPFRSETQASFKVSIMKNRWYDHGAGIGGNVIDLVSLVLKCSIKETLEFLSDSNAVFSVHQQQTSVVARNHNIEILKVQEISHPALVQYSNSRKIPIQILTIFCKQVWYRYRDSVFFAIGLENRNGGWELSNRNYKTSSSPKSYTYYNYGHQQLVVFEGMFDLLSLMVLDPELINASDIIVLNSISFIRDIKYLFEKYPKGILFLDHDSAGRKATKELLDNFHHLEDGSMNYYKYKDLNDYLCHGFRD
ncbi:toprim domain-containing protein [Formosa sp. A9]|uniref:toprim domain-containing protein n=1 Tax=Formosa sp. A9 TaxID=3442641 RepID=UPI003EBDA9B8